MAASLSNFNWSLFTVPAAWLLAQAPRAYSVPTYDRFSKASRKDEILQAPRGFRDIVTQDTTIPPLIRGRILRAEGAMFNQLENLGFFAAAVTAGNAAGLDFRLLNRLSLGYLGLRVVYTIVYIYNDTAKYVPVRTAIFFSSSLISWGLFVLAGLKINGRSQPL